MAGEATIGALRVVLGADTAKFEDNLNKAGASLSSFGKKIAAITAGVGLERVLEKAITGIIHAIRDAIDHADKLGKASQKFGVPVEQLSALAHAAALSDVSLEQLGSSLGRLSKNMVAAQNATSEQAAAFKALEISVKDGNKQLKSSDQILLEVADAFSKFEDGTTKTALAIAIFGRAGADMIPLLNQGAAAIKKQREQMEKLGLVVTPETSKNAEKFNDNLKDLGLTFTAIVTKIIGSSGLLQLMTDLSSALVNVANDSKTMEAVGNALGSVIKFVAIQAVELSNQFKQLANDVRFLSKLQPDTTFREAGQAFREWQAESKRLNAETAITVKRLQEMGTAAADVDNAIDTVLQTLAKLDALRAKGPPPVFDPAAARAAAAEAKKFSDELKSLEVRAIETSGIFAGQLAPGFLTAATNMKHLDGQVIDLKNRFLIMGPEAQKLNDALLKLEGLKLSQEFLTPWDQYLQKLREINLLLEKQAINADTAEKAGRKAAVNMQVVYGQAAEGVVSGWADAFKTLAAENKEFAGIAKALAIAQAIINAYVAANVQLANTILPWPLPLIAAAGAIAAGLANVAKIQSTNFAHGGSFRVAGSGGVDSQLIQFMASPGEMVDVRTPGQVGSGGGVQTIELRTPRVRDFFSEHVRELVDTLNRAAPDGYVIKMPA